jgi:hypothetical protein
MQRLREGLKVQRDFISATRGGEGLYIQYPGKESTRAGAKRRPWDFFPVLVKPDGTQARDLGFNDIFGESYDSLMSIKSALPRVRAFGALVYRMAFMLDHKLVSPKAAKLRKSPPDLARQVVVRPAEGTLPQFYVYSPDAGILEELSKHTPTIGELTLEGFLRYCDILAWNEDSKYYYSKVEQGTASWLASTGRVNTLLTLMRVVGLVTGDVHLGDLLGGFNYGTSAASPAEAASISGGLIR